MEDSTCSSSSSLQMMLHGGFSLQGSKDTEGCLRMLLGRLQTLVLLTINVHDVQFQRKGKGAVCSQSNCCCDQVAAFDVLEDDPIITLSSSSTMHGLLWFLPDAYWQSRQASMCQVAWTCSRPPSLMECMCIQTEKVDLYKLVGAGCNFSPLKTLFREQSRWLLSVCMLSHIDFLPAVTNESSENLLEETCICTLAVVCERQCRAWRGICKPFEPLLSMPLSSERLPDYSRPAVSMHVKPGLPENCFAISPRVGATQSQSLSCLALLVL